MKNLALFLEFLTEERKNKLLGRVKKRTRFLTVVIEDVYQPHNASAILRTCDAFGIQDVYVIEKENKFQPNRGVSLGAEKWLNIYTSKDPQEIYQMLKKKGYKIVATVPPDKKYPYQTLPEFKPMEKLALVFGSELEGLSSFWLEKADHYLTIPMYGFVESFNISVSVAIILYDLVHKLKNKKEFYLSSTEREEILIYWLKKEIKGFEKIEETLKLKTQSAKRKTTA